MADTQTDPELLKIHTLARTMWAFEWKLQNPDADKDAMNASWNTAKSQQYKTTRKLLKNLQAKGFEFTSTK
jgi:hypothetical protein